ncbi:glutathione S-transferase [Methylocella silvestris]|uniref:Glutathione S-transferase n=2 Tax=Methylocella silvestris TaxID=199596 RepID=A0A2J7TFA9_METSI|nr:glutathione S-transferase family protein [Methylocella silvestris]PNG25455.1 glutathione S-transferase [Methylocella silvestris]
MKTGNCIRAAMALEEAELPYVVRHYDPRAPGEGEVEYRRLNPTGKVPTLIDLSQRDDPFVLTQSNAIVLYAGSKAPEKLLHAGDARAQARVLERFTYFVTDVIVPNHAGFFLKLQGDAVAAKVLSDRSMAAIEDAERFASASTFIAGDAFSIADIAAVTIVSAVADELPWDRLPALSRWFSQVRTRPAFVRSTSAFDG